MFDIVGRILTINKISEKVSQVIIKKQVRGKQIPIAFATFGYCKVKMEALNLNKNDKVQIRFMIKSNYFKEKFYTDVTLEEIKRYEPKPKYNPQQPNTRPEHELFYEGDEEIGSGGIGNTYIIDDETGEILL
jgi:hypothetical protein